MALKQVSPGLKIVLEIITLLKIFLPSLWINIVAAAVEVRIASEPQANSSKISEGISGSNINLFTPNRSTFSPKLGLNCLNKKPINTIITDDIADKTCALSSAGDIESIEKKFPNWKRKSIEPIIIYVLPLKFIHIKLSKLNNYYQ